MGSPSGGGEIMKNEVRGIRSNRTFSTMFKDFVFSLRVMGSHGRILVLST